MDNIDNGDNLSNNQADKHKSIAQIAAQIKSGAVLSFDLVKSAIENIEKFSDLNAVLWRDDSAALSRARDVDSGKINGALAGIPVIIKDNIDVENMPCTCGSIAFKDRISQKNAVVVDRLLKHGAVIVGKANMDEFAMGSSNTTSAFGNVLNPLDKTRVPGGSSGGSAAAVAANLCFASLGSDTGGSIRQPASYCGIVGLKPTYGSVCGDGCFPLAPSMDQIGPLARTVSDCALIYGAICDEGIDEFIDIRPRGGSIVVVKEVLEELENLSVITDSNGSSKLKSAFINAIEWLKSCGCMVRMVSVPSFMKACIIYKTEAYAEISKTMQGIDAGLLGKEVNSRVLIGKRAIDSPDVLEHSADLRKKLTDEMNAALEDAHAMLLPTAMSVAFQFSDDVSKKEIEFSDRFTQPSSIAGLPSLSVPFCRINGMPMGMQLVGEKYREKALFGIAKLLINEK